MNSKQSFFSIVISCIAFCSCHNWDTVDEPQKDSFTPNELYAIKRADDFLTELYGKESRGEERTVSGITPILQKAQSRTGASNDTIAYVINYRNNNGFAIVAHSEDIHHLLAFSDQGQFSFENEIAVTQFVNNINGYIENYCLSEQMPVSRMQEYFRTYPFVKTYLGQDYPYNSVVDKYHPGCMVGCVPVALANVMMYSRNKDVVYKRGYELAEIRYGLESKTGEYDDRWGRSSGVYSLEEAQAETAELLYGLGFELGVNYGTDQSSASSYDAYSYLRKKGYNLKTGYYAFKSDDIVRRLVENCIVYCRGEVRGTGNGHAWVCDGCYYMLSGDIIADVYLHFDWGWQGYCNGFYRGEIFTVPIYGGDYTIAPMNYIAVEREY